MSCMIAPISHDSSLHMCATAICECPLYKLEYPSNVKHVDLCSTRFSYTGIVHGNHTHFPHVFHVHVLYVNQMGIYMGILHMNHMGAVQLTCGYQTAHMQHVATIQLTCGCHIALVWLLYCSHKWLPYSLYVATIQLPYSSHVAAIQLYGSHL